MTVRSLRLWAFLLAVAASAGMALPWVDPGEAPVIEKARTTPGYENYGTDEHPALPHPRAWAVDLGRPILLDESDGRRIVRLSAFGLLLAATCPLAAVLAFLARAAGARGRGDRARRWSAASFTCSLLAVVLSAALLLRGAGPPLASVFKIPVIPFFTWPAYAVPLVALASAACSALVVARTTAAAVGPR